MMTTTAVSSALPSTDVASNSDVSSLGQDAFLKLLITQLRNQDPMSPMADQDFIAQLAQFSSLEQMQQLNSGFDALGKSAAATQAFAMIGKTIDYADPSTGSALTGLVGGASFVDGWPQLRVDSTLVDLSDVLAVY